jgi:hypothetical protein
MVSSALLGDGRAHLDKVEDLIRVLGPRLLACFDKRASEEIVARIDLNGDVLPDMGRLYARFQLGRADRFPFGGNATGISRR